jgi:glycosyltransferase involved in cell wall biosynthesis
VSGEQPTAGGGIAPSVTAVVPTYDNATTLPAALESLAAQEYAGAVDVVCVDGGSNDATRAIAERFGARVVENPERNEEEGRALGVEAATGEYVLLLDADNELPAADWLSRLVRAASLAPDVVSADPLYHEWRASDPPVTRLCALLGGTDPLAIDLGWADRWAAHLDRWTGLEVEVEDADDALVVRLDPQRPPPMGSNGFLVRRDALLATRYRPFVHSDVVGDLAEAGFRFARVREGVVHHYAPTLRAYARKARRRARRTVRREPVQRRGLEVDRRRVVLRAAWAMTLVGPVLAAIRGYRTRPDPAWALLPALYVITTLAYAQATLAAGLAGALARRSRGDRPS